MLGRPNVGDIGDPFGVGGCRGEVSVQMILRACRTNSRALHSPPHSLRHALQPCPRHQTCHPMTSTPLPSIAQVFLDALTAHDPIMVGMHRTDSLQ
jgi:hypothetical protein